MGPHAIPMIGGARGLKDIIDTGAYWLAKGYDKATGGDKPNLSNLVTGQPQGEAARVQAMNEAGKKEFDAAAQGDWGLQGGRLAGQVIGTAPVGGLLAAPVKLAAKAAPALGPLADAIASAGFRAGTPAPGLLSGAGNLATRSLGGAITGGASAGLLNPDQAGAGAAIGAILPPALKAAGAAGGLLRNSVLGTASPEIADLARRAQQLGIDIPADRITNSKPLNAVAESLNYIPLSGRQATERRMEDQLNTALSKTFGQDSPNVTMALRKADSALGTKFETTLKNNAVNVDQQFLTDLADSANKASRELGSDGASIIQKQVDDIVSKAATGQIDGQAAYNIKKTLDRIGQRNTPEAFYATDLKKALMGALDRSLGPTEAAAFKQTRQQYGNMLDLEKIAQNGAEVGVSVARLANMKNIGNPQMQELADIAAQFVKKRESAHGAAQRVSIGFGAPAIGGAFGGPLGAALAAGGTIAAGRLGNAGLNSGLLRSGMTGGNPGLRQLTDEAAQGLYLGLPPVAAQR